ncbi:MAG: TIM barrel protein [Mariniblastus sp.]|nr:TIM barrel protein [Mariniblastus sp.]
MSPQASKALSRRRFLQTTAITSGALGSFTLLPGLGFKSAAASAVDSNSLPDNRGRIYKSVKWGMIQDGQTVLEKFQLNKDLGFDGMELVSPSNLDLDEVMAASRETGMPVHGLVNQKHWQVRLSSPDPSQREQGKKILDQCLHDAHSLGGDSVLLVPGRVKGAEESHDHVWQRSIVEIRKSLPLASRLGVRILIENVWNRFCETPEQFRDYLDEINSPWVGAYFDIGNVRKFSPPENWIRVLGNRIVKLDVKDWGKQGGFCKIGDGDVDWNQVREALAEIEFTGWSTAEVSGGNRERLAEIAERMNRCLAL